MSTKDSEIELLKVTQQDTDFLYELIKEREKYPVEFRTPSSELPTFREHELFVNSFIENNNENLYREWFIIFLKNKLEEKKVGAIVLKKNGEWGYHILMKYWDQGIGTITAKKLFSMFQETKLWARVKPQNKRAIHQLEKLGFTLTSLTYEKTNYVKND